MTPTEITTTIDLLNEKPRAAHGALQSLSGAIYAATQKIQYAELSADDMACFRNLPVILGEILQAIELRRNADLLVTMAELATP